MAYSCVPNSLSGGFWVDQGGGGEYDASLGYDTGLGTVFTVTYDNLNVGANPDSEIGFFLAIGGRAYFEGDDFVGFGLGLGIGGSRIHDLLGIGPFNVQAGGSVPFLEGEF